MELNDENKSFVHTALCLYLDEHGKNLSEESRSKLEELICRELIRRYKKRDYKKDSIWNDPERTVSISEYDFKEKWVVIETERGKVKLSFKDWEIVAGAYYKFVERREVHPCDEDKSKLLNYEDTVTLPKRIWDKIPYAFKYWDAKHNKEPKEAVPTEQ